MCDANNLLAYLAGAMDSDGYFSIKKSTYHIRVVKDSINPSYSEKIGLKQVTREVPELLKKTFGGSLRLEKKSTKNGKPLFSWTATDINASEACRLLLPFLLIKIRQANLILELRESKDEKYRKPSYWFLQEFPYWESMEMITLSKASSMLNHRNSSSISRCIASGSILALPYNHKKEEARIPRLLIERLIECQSSDGKAIVRPPELITWREKLCQEIRELNKIGTGEHPIYLRTGPYAPAKIN